MHRQREEPTPPRRPRARVPVTARMASEGHRRAVDAEDRRAAGCRSRPASRSAWTASRSRGTRFSVPRAARSIGVERARPPGPRPGAGGGRGAARPAGSRPRDRAGRARSGGDSSTHELVDAHDDPRPALDLLLVAIRRILDLPLHEGNRRHRAAEPVDLVEVRRGAVLDVPREALDQVRPAEGVDGRRHARLVREDLLGPERGARTAASEGSDRASSIELVWSDWQPPRMAASACTVTRTTLFSGCCAVSVEPAVWAWNRSIMRRAGPGRRTAPA